MPRRLSHVDVFGSAPMRGNPLAVVHDAAGMSGEEMLALTRWLDLSETTFLMPPIDDGADYRVRIFTPAHELPFAGHPTLGTCHAWLEAGGVAHQDDRVVQECGAGLVELRRIEDRLAFAAPPLQRDGPLSDDELAEHLDACGLDHDDVVDAAWVDNGPGWCALLLRDVETLRAVRPPSRHDDGIFLGLVALTDRSSPAGPATDVDVELRALFSGATGDVREDPVTGSLNASVAQWLLSTGRVETPYVAAQGRHVGADGRVHVSQDADGGVWVAGRTVTVATGQLA